MTNINTSHYTNKMWCDELTEYLKQIGANKGQILAELERWPDIAEIYK